MKRVIPLKDATYVVEKFIFYFSVKKSIYYINTNEIPGELSRENIKSSHVKITCYPRCYGYIIAPFAGKNCFSEMVWYFTGVAALTREIFFNTRREISYLQAAL